MNQEREAVARIIDPTAWEEYLLEDGRVDTEVAAVFRDAYEESLAKADAILALRSGGEGWRPMQTAPKDGTPILAVARYLGATSGFPQIVHWYGGAWRSPGRTVTEPLVAWAWQPRPETWPSEGWEVASPSTHGEG